ncbi:MAG: HEAT repeat domain-containing protein [Candidatus Parabeggiatoa sp.]|nr:HEAT repeat domain-containing protein [Candidatus Parabeggiatoa sp.]
MNTEHNSAIQHAEDLADAGKREEAFLAYTAIPGAQHLALSLAKPVADVYLEILQTHWAELPPVFARLMQGELLSATGDLSAALSAYRATAELLKTVDTLEEKDIPSAYLTEPPEEAKTHYPLTQAFPVFAAGPGSHRDNRLIRRFIALDAFADVEREFERVWQLYLAGHIFPRWEVSLRNDNRFVPGETWSIWSKGPFDTLSEDEETVQLDHRALPFALDYAYFLQKNDQTTTAAPLRTGSRYEVVLLTALERLSATADFQNPVMTKLKQLKQEYQDFLRQSYGFFKQAGRESHLLEALEEKIAAGHNPLRRLVAWIYFHRQEPSHALHYEFAYLEQAPLDKISVFYRQGRAYEVVQQPKKAIEVYGAALALCQSQWPADPATPRRFNEIWRAFEPLGKIYAANLLVQWKKQQTRFELETELMSYTPKPRPGDARRFNFEELSKTAQQFAQAGETARFHEWLRLPPPAAQDAETRALCGWFLGEYEAYCDMLSEFLEQLMHQWYCLGRINNIQQQFAEAGQKELFLKWAQAQRSRLPECQEPAVRAEFYCFLGDYEEAARAVAPVLVFVGYDHRINEKHRYGNWLKFLIVTLCHYDPYGAPDVEKMDYPKAKQKQFQQSDKTPVRVFLRTLLAHYPEHPRLLFDLFSLRESADDPADAERICMYEAVVRDRHADLYALGRQHSQLETFYNLFCPLFFADRYDLAYQLMLLYEKHGYIDRLCALGLSIASGEAPFDDWQKMYPYFFTNQNRPSRYFHACLFRLVHYADDGLLEKLTEIWGDYPELPAYRQLVRRTGKNLPGIEDKEGLKSVWANLPEEDRFLVSCENVLALARDEHYFYAGHPWGVAVYDFQGNTVIRIALPSKVVLLAAGQGSLWAATRDSLFRTEIDTWTVSRLDFSGVNAGDFRGVVLVDGPPPYPEDDESEPLYSALLLDGDELWIGTDNGVHCLETNRLHLRRYSMASHCTRFYADADYIWAAQDGKEDDENGLVYRYTRATEHWDKIKHKGQTVNLVDAVDGQLFGQVTLKDAGTRLCLIDRHSLQITVIPFADEISGRRIGRRGRTREVSLHQPVFYAGRYRGQLIFGDSRYEFGYYRYDAIGNRLYAFKNEKLLHELEPARPLLCEIYNSGDYYHHRYGGNSTPPRRLFPPLYANSGDSSAYRTWKTAYYAINNRNFIAAHLIALTLPDGTVVYGGPLHLREHIPPGGLHLSFPDGRYRRISDHSHPDTLRGEHIFSIAENLTEGEVWLCTNDGLVILDRDGHINTEINVGCGLLNHAVTAAVPLGEKIYLPVKHWYYRENDKRHYYSFYTDSGLAVFHPNTRVVTTFLQQNGLRSESMAALVQEKNQLRIVYGPTEEWTGKAKQYTVYPDDILKPDGLKRATGKVRILSEAQIEPVCQHLNALAPDHHKTATINGIFWTICNNGLYISPTRKAPQPVIAVSPVSREEPDQPTIKTKSPNELFLKSTAQETCRETQKFDEPDVPPLVETESPADDKALKSLKRRLKKQKLEALPSLLSEALQHREPYYRAKSLVILMEWMCEQLEAWPEKDESIGHDGNVDTPSHFLTLRRQKRSRKMLSRIHNEVSVLLATAATDDADIRVRDTAFIWLLVFDQSAQSVPALRTKLHDGHFIVRMLATLALGLRGESVLVEIIRECLIKKREAEKNRRKRDWLQKDEMPFYGNKRMAPYQDDVFSLLDEKGIIHDVDYSSNIIYTILARIKDAEVLKLIAEYPPENGDDSMSKYVYPQVGAHLPQEAGLVSKFLNTPPDDEERQAALVKFFTYANKAVLPLLHEGLRSDDRVIRSNAARACGALAEPASVQSLIQALDFESSLARASIVWALGELGAAAREAVAVLLKLYTVTEEEDKCRKYRQDRTYAACAFSQMASRIESESDLIQDRETLNAEWDEIKAGHRPHMIDPRAEELLTAQHIRTALNKIAPADAAVQELYRHILRTERTASDAHEDAVIQLAVCAHEDKEKNILALRLFLETTYDVEAAVSMLILCDTEIAQPYILEHFGPAILRNLHRVKDTSKLAFAHQAIKKALRDIEPELKEYNGQHYLTKYCNWAREIVK